MSPFKRIIAGDPWRMTRLHDMRGNFIGAKALVADLPLVTLQAFARRAFSWYPALPWIPYPAIRALEALARPGWHVLEHGAGQSTIWWAQRVAQVRSIEANAEWYERIRGELVRRALTNVQIEHRDGDHYSNLSMLPDAHYDAIVIDGHDRERVAKVVPRLLKPGGIVYFDNSDFAAEWHQMYGETEDILLAWATSIGATATYFTGMPPATMTANQGLLIQTSVA